MRWSHKLNKIILRNCLKLPEPLAGSLSSSGNEFQTVFPEESNFLVYELHAYPEDSEVIESLEHVQFFLTSFYQTHGPSGVARVQRLGGGKVEIWGTEISQRGLGEEPWWGFGRSSQELKSTTKILRLESVNHARKCVIISPFFLSPHFFSFP